MSCATSFGNEALPFFSFNCYSTRLTNGSRVKPSWSLRWSGRAPPPLLASISTKGWNYDFNLFFLSCKPLGLKGGH